MQKNKENTLFAIAVGKDSASFALCVATSRTAGGILMRDAMLITFGWPTSKRFVFYF
jgi:hypothetical protein